MTQPTSDTAPPALVTASAVPKPRRLRWVVLAGVIGLLIAGWFGGREQWVHFQLRSAEQASERYDFPQALSHYEKALKVRPDDIELRLKAARAARRASLFTRAEEHYAEYEKRRGMTKSLALEWAMWSAQQGNLGDVEQTLQRAVVEGHPAAVLILESLAQGYLAVYRLGYAIATIQMLLERSPDHPDARFWRGGILEGSGKPIEALEDYKRAVELLPSRTAYRLRYAEALLRNKQAAEARPHFIELLRLDATDAKVLLGAARCSHSLALPAEAKTHLDSLLLQHPDNAAGWAELGQLASEENNNAEAVRCLRRAAELAPGSYAHGYALSVALHAQGLTEEANAMTARLGQLKRDEDRLGEINLALSKAPQNPALRYEAGMICLRNKVDDEAFRWFLGALQDDAHHRPTHAALADLYQRKGNADRANHHRELAK